MEQLETGKIVSNDTTINIAKYIIQLYFEKFNDIISEFKLHTLLYLTQRESLIRNPNEPILTEDFYAYNFGPGLKTIRKEYKNLIKGYQK